MGDGGVADDQISDTQIREEYTIQKLLNKGRDGSLRLRKYLDVTCVWSVMDQLK